MKEKNSAKYFGFFLTTLLYMNMKNYKNIACTDFENVNVALNLHSSKEN